MTDHAQSPSKTIEEWLMRVEGAAMPVPSWIPSAQRAALHATPGIESAMARMAISIGPPPPSARPLSSLIPPLSLMPPQIAILESSPDLSEENAALRKQLAEMALSMARLRTEVLEASEGDLVRLACGIAERLAARELASDPKLAVGWAREAIAALGGKEDVVIAVAPDLSALLRADDWATLTGPTVRVEVDPSLASFGCEVRQRASVVDASLHGRIAAITRELGVSTK